MLNTMATGENGLERTLLALPLPWPHARDAGEDARKGTTWLPLDFNRTAAGSSSSSSSHDASPASAPWTEQGVGVQHRVYSASSPTGGNIKCGSELALEVVFYLLPSPSAAQGRLDP